MPGRPKGSKDGAGAVQPKPFRAVREDAGGWLVVTGVGTGTRKARALELSVLVPVLATAKGSLLGSGVVTRRGETLVITA